VVPEKEAIRQLEDQGVLVMYQKERELVEEEIKPSKVVSKVTT